MFNLYFLMKERIMKSSLGQDLYKSWISTYFVSYNITLKPFELSGLV